VILINENSLSPVNPEHFRRLLAEMRAFLRLDAADGP
jgi:Fe-S cluster biosynthesis and repair protein YggX